MSSLKERVKDYSKLTLMVITACIILIAGFFVTGPASGQGPEKKEGPPPARSLTRKLEHSSRFGRTNG